jgi:hypothetical protein
MIDAIICLAKQVIIIKLVLSSSSFFLFSQWTFAKREERNKYFCVIEARHTKKLMKYFVAITIVIHL